MEIQTSPEVDQIAKALAQAQKAFRPAKLDSRNPHYNNRYPSVSSVLDAALGPLNEQGIALVQIPISEDGQVGVHTRLIHSSGQYLGGNLLLRPVRNDPQGWASCVTYSRRYSLLGFLGLGVGEAEDDDGNAASRGGATITQEQAIDLASLIEEANSSPSKVLSYCGASSLSEVSPADFQRVCSMLRKKIKAGAK